MGIIYNDYTYNDLLARVAPVMRFIAPGYLPRLTKYGSPAAERFGLKPATDDLTPVPQSDWKEVIQDCHAKKIFAMYHRASSPVLEQAPSQNGLNYCWAWAARAALENVRLLEGQGAVKLAPVSLGWLVRWRNAGNYLDVTVKALRERGICSAGFVPDQHSRNPQTFKPGWEQDALNYRLGEAWDTNRSEGAISMISQCLAVLKTGASLYVALNWWSHALIVDGMDWGETQQNNVVWDYFNSHADGPIRLAGSKGVPDEAYGLAVSSVPA